MASEFVVCHLANHVVAVGHDVASTLISKGIAPSKRVSVLANGSANGVSSPLNVEHPDGDILRSHAAIFVGRITEDKGIHDLLAAWRLVRRTHPDAELHLYGRREKDAVSGKLAQTLDSTPGVVEKGHWDDLRIAYASAKILVLPTYREGLPTVVLEAAAHGVPSIVTDVTGAREPVIDRVTGLIVPAHSPELLAAAIGELLQNDSFRERIGTNARDHVLDRYGRDHVHRAWSRFLGSMVS